MLRSVMTIALGALMVVVAVEHQRLIEWFAPPTQKIAQPHEYIYGAESACTFPAKKVVSLVCDDDGIPYFAAYDFVVRGHEERVLVYAGYRHYREEIHSETVMRTRLIFVKALRVFPVSLMTGRPSVSFESMLSGAEHAEVTMHARIPRDTRGC